MRYEVQSDGSLSHGTVFADVTSEPGEEALDGMKVDRAGNIFFSGPGGLWVCSHQGMRLGLLKLPELPANMAWGDADGKTLYLTARTGLYRIRMETGQASQPMTSVITALETNSLSVTPSIRLCPRG